MSQAELTSGPVPPPALVDGLVLQTTASAHRAAVQALAPMLRGPGQTIFAAIDSADLSLPLAVVPSILSPDARAARLIRGTP